MMVLAHLLILGLGMLVGFATTTWLVVRYL